MKVRLPVALMAALFAAITGSVKAENFVWTGNSSNQIVASGNWTPVSGTAPDWTQNGYDTMELGASEKNKNLIYGNGTYYLGGLVIKGTGYAISGTHAEKIILDGNGAGVLFKIEESSQFNAAVDYTDTKITKGFVVVDDNLSLNISLGKTFTWDAHFDGGSGKTISVDGGGTFLVLKDAGPKVQLGHADPVEASSAKLYADWKVSGNSSLAVGNGGLNGTLGYGNIQIDSGSTLQFHHSTGYLINNAISGTGTLAFKGGTTYTLGAAASSGFSGILVLDTNCSLVVETELRLGGLSSTNTSSLYHGTKDIFLNFGGASFSFLGTLTGSATDTATKVNLTFEGGTLVFKGNRDEGGIVSVKDGGILDLRSGGRLFSKSGSSELNPLQVLSGGTVIFDKFHVGDSNNLSNLSLVGSSILVDGGTLEFFGTDASNNGTNSNDATDLTKIGMRGFTIGQNGATLKVDDGAVFIHLDAGGGIIAPYSHSTLTLTCGPVPASSPSTVKGSGKGTLMSPVSGAGAGTLKLVKEGINTWILAGDFSSRFDALESSESFGGGITVKGGTLQIGDGNGNLTENGTVKEYKGVLGTTTSIVVEAGAFLVFNRADAYQVRQDASSVTNVILNDISGEGSVSFTGGGSYVLDSNKGYEGGTIISGYSNLVLDFTSLGAGSQNVLYSGQVLTLSGGTLSFLCRGIADHTHWQHVNELVLEKGYTSFLQLSGRASFSMDKLSSRYGTFGTLIVETSDDDNRIYIANNQTVSQNAVASNIIFIKGGTFYNASISSMPVVIPEAGKTMYEVEKAGEVKRLSDSLVSEGGISYQQYGTGIVAETWKMGNLFVSSRDYASEDKKLTLSDGVSVSASDSLIFTGEDKYLVEGGTLNTRFVILDLAQGKASSGILGIQSTLNVSESIVFNDVTGVVEISGNGTLGGTKNNAVKPQAILGKGTFIKSGAADTIFSLNASSNLYTGNINVTGGLLQANVAGAIGRAASLVVSTGGTVEYAERDSIQSDIRLWGGRLLVSWYGYPYNMSNNIHFNASGGGTVEVVGIAGTEYARQRLVKMTGEVLDTGDLTKTGLGILMLTNAGSWKFTGDVYLNEGILQWGDKWNTTGNTGKEFWLGHKNNTTQQGGRVYVAAGASFSLAMHSGTGLEKKIMNDIILRGNDSQGAGELRIDLGSYILNGGVEVVADNRAVINFAGNSFSVDITGELTGSGTLDIWGTSVKDQAASWDKAAQVILSHDNSFSGTLNVMGRVYMDGLTPQDHYTELVLNHEASATYATVNLDSTLGVALLKLTTARVTVAGLSSQLALGSDAANDKSFVYTSAAHTELTVNTAKDVQNAYAGTFKNNISLIKDGEGELALLGDNSEFTGGITLKNGTLVLAGDSALGQIGSRNLIVDTASSSPVNGAILVSGAAGGVLTVDSLTVFDDSRLDLGGINSSATLNVGKDVVLNNATFVMDISLEERDLINVTGTLSLLETLTVVTFDLDLLSFDSDMDSIVLLHASNGILGNFSEASFKVNDTSAITDGRRPVQGRITVGNADGGTGALKHDLLLAIEGGAADLYWEDTTDSWTWKGGTEWRVNDEKVKDYQFYMGDRVHFNTLSGVDAQTVQISGTPQFPVLKAGAMFIDTPGEGEVRGTDYTFDGGEFIISGQFRKTGSGAVLLSGTDGTVNGEFVFGEGSIQLQDGATLVLKDKISIDPEKAHFAFSGGVLDVSGSKNGIIDLGILDFVDEKGGTLHYGDKKIIVGISSEHVAEFPDLDLVGTGAVQAGGIDVLVVKDLERLMYAGKAGIYLTGVTDSSAAPKGIYGGSWDHQTAMSGYLFIGDEEELTRLNFGTGYDDHQGIFGAGASLGNSKDVRRENVSHIYINGTNEAGVWSTEITGRIYGGGVKGADIYGSTGLNLSGVHYIGGDLQESGVNGAAVLVGGGAEGTTVSGDVAMGIDSSLIDGLVYGTGGSVTGTLTISVTDSTFKRNVYAGGFGTKTRIQGAVLFADGGNGEKGSLFEGSLYGGYEGTAKSIQIKLDGSVVKGDVWGGYAVEGDASLPSRVTNGAFLDLKDVSVSGTVGIAHSRETVLGGRFANEEGVQIFGSYIHIEGDNTHIGNVEGAGRKGGVIGSDFTIDILGGTVGEGRRGLENAFSFSGQGGKVDGFTLLNMFGGTIKNEYLLMSGSGGAGVTRKSVLYFGGTGVIESNIMAAANGATVGNTCEFYLTGGTLGLEGQSRSLSVGTRDVKTGNVILTLSGSESVGVGTSFKGNYAFYAGTWDEFATSLVSLENIYTRDRDGVSGIANFKGIISGASASEAEGGIMSAGKKELVFSAYLTDVQASLENFSSVVVKNSSQVTLLGTGRNLDGWQIEDWSVLNLSHSAALGGAKLLSILSSAAIYFTAGASEREEITSVITGSGDFYKKGTGELLLSGNNGLYSGIIHLDTGKLTAGHQNALGRSAVAVIKGTTLDLGSYELSNALNVNGGATLERADRFNGALNVLGRRTDEGSLQPVAVSSNLSARILNMRNQDSFLQVKGDITVSSGGGFRLDDSNSIVNRNPNSAPLILAYNGDVRLGGIFDLDFDSSSHLVNDKITFQLFKGNSYDQLAGAANIQFLLTHAYDAFYEVSSVDDFKQNGQVTISRKMTEMPEGDLVNQWDVNNTYKDGWSREINNYLGAKAVDYVVNFDKSYTVASHDDAYRLTNGLGWMNFTSRITEQNFGSTRLLIDEYNVNGLDKEANALRSGVILSSNANSYTGGTYVNNVHVIVDGTVTDNTITPGTGSEDEDGEVIVGDNHLHADNAGQADWLAGKVNILGTGDISLLGSHAVLELRTGGTLESDKSFQFSNAHIYMADGASLIQTSGQNTIHAELLLSGGKEIVIANTIEHALVFTGSVSAYNLALEGNAGLNRAGATPCIIRFDAAEGSDPLKGLVDELTLRKNVTMEVGDAEFAVRRLTMGGDSVLHLSRGSEFSLGVVVKGEGGAEINLDGGTLTLDTNVEFGLDNQVKLSVGSADSSNLDILDGRYIKVHSLTGSGGLRKQGLGHLILAGDSSGYDGLAVVESGSLKITGETGAEGVFGGSVQVGQAQFTVSDGVRIDGGISSTTGARMELGKKVTVGGDLDVAEGSTLSTGEQNRYEGNLLRVGRDVAVEFGRDSLFCAGEVELGSGTNISFGDRTQFQGGASGHFLIGEGTADHRTELTFGSSSDDRITMNSDFGANGMVFGNHTSYTGFLDAGDNHLSFLSGSAFMVSGSVSHNPSGRRPGALHTENGTVSLEQGMTFSLTGFNKIDLDAYEDGFCLVSAGENGRLEISGSDAAAKTQYDGYLSGHDQFAWLTFHLMTGEDGKTLNLNMEGEARYEDSSLSGADTFNEWALVPIANELSNHFSSYEGELADLGKTLILATKDNSHAMLSELALSTSSIAAGYAVQVENLRRHALNIRDRAVLDNPAKFRKDYETWTSNIWASGLGGSYTLDGDHNAVGNRSSVWGGTLGTSRCVTGNLILGMAFTYTDTDVTVDNGYGSATSGAYYIDFFSRYRCDEWSVTAVVTGGFTDLDTARNMNVGDFQSRTKGSSSGSQILGMVEVGYDFRISRDQKSILEPFGMFSAGYSSMGSFQETGAGTAGLSVRSSSQGLCSVGAGLRFVREFDTVMNSQNQGRMETRAMVIQELGDNVINTDASFIGAPDRRFTTEYAAPGKTALSIGAGTVLPVTQKMALFLDGSGEFRTDETGWNVNAGVKYSF